jgi:hypothetical protein
MNLPVNFHSLAEWKLSDPHELYQSPHFDGFLTAIENNSTIRRIHIAKMTSNDIVTEQLHRRIQSIRNARNMPLTSIEMDMASLSHQRTILQASLLAALLQSKRHTLQRLIVWLPVQFASVHDVQHVADALCHSTCLQEISLLHIIGHANTVPETLSQAAVTIPTLTTVQWARGLHMLRSRYESNNAIPWNAMFSQWHVLAWRHWGFTEPFLLDLLRHMQQLKHNCTVKLLDIRFTAPHSVTDPVKHMLLSVAQCCPRLCTVVTDGDDYDNEWRLVLDSLLQVNAAGRYRFLYDSQTTRDECCEILMCARDNVSVVYSLLRQRPLVLFLNAL